jgi:uncharacterized protein
MTYKPHDLVSEFPEQAARIHALKQSDAHFARLAERYGEVNHEILRIEGEVTPASDETVETLKKQRLNLLDEISALLAKAA